MVCNQSDRKVTKYYIVTNYLIIYFISISHYIKKQGNDIFPISLRKDLCLINKETTDLSLNKDRFKKISVVSVNGINYRINTLQIYV